MRAHASAERRLRPVALALAAASVAVTLELARPPRAAATEDVPRTRVVATFSALATPDSLAPAGAPASAESSPAKAGAGTPEAGVRVPGTWMRLGQTPEQMLARAQFQAAAGPRGQPVQKGEVAWFGIPSVATLHFHDDRLDVVEFLVEDAAPYWTDYVRDQLRLAGYRPWCRTDEPGLAICEWRGATLVNLEVRDRRLHARVTAAGPATATHLVQRPGRTPARRDTVPVHPQVFVLGRAAPAGVSASPVLADSTPLVSPALPPAASEAGVQGRVWVRALVDTSGAVERATIARGIAELDSAAVAVARRCRFQPFAPEGVRVRFQIEIPVLFRVRE